MYACLIAVALAAAPQDPDVVRAATLFELGEFDNAQALLAELLARPGLAESDRALAFQYLAATHLAEGNEAEARRTLEQMVTQLPSARVDAARFDPRLVKMHDDARARLATATPAPLPGVTAPARERPSRVVPISMIAAGAVVQGASLYGLASVRTRYAQWESAGPGERLEFTREQAQRDHLLHAASWAGTAVGVGLIGAGVWMLVSEDQAPPVAAATLLPGGGVAASLHGSF